MKYKTLFPPQYSIVSHDPDKFLITTYYDLNVDTLFQLYYDTKTKKTELKEEKAPYVPVFLSKNPRKSPLDYIDSNLTERYLIRYKDKNDELRNMLFSAKEIRYTNKKTGERVEKLIFPNVPKNAEFLHPDLFMADLTIEECVMIDYTYARYQTDPVSGVSYENTPVPHDLKIAAFDIETIEDPDGWKIHTNTFIDETSGHAYLDYLIRDDFNKQNILYENPKFFVETVRKTLYDAIESCTYGDSKKGKTIKKICHGIADKLKFKLRAFKTEEELITETTKLMFTTYKPHILTAFNAPYDLGMFQRRIDELNLPKGTLNQRGLGYDNVAPPFASWRVVNGFGRKAPNLDENYKFFGDMLNPKKRRTYLNVISHTAVLDLQTTFFSSRQGNNYSSFSLNATATEVLGFGKFDYSSITNSILRLAKVDYFWHSVYALIDSILLLMINRVNNEFDSKLAYAMRTKVNIEETAASNSAISRCVQTEAFIMGWIAGNNYNKILRSMKSSDVEKLSESTGVNYKPYARAVKYKPDYSGGLVSSPVKLQPIYELIQHKNILSKEAYLTLFMRVPNCNYLDFKSHYPISIVVRNISKGTLFAKIVQIEYKNKDIRQTIFKSKAKKGQYQPHFGNVNLSMAEKDIVGYCNICNNTPSLGELTQLFISFDSEPIFSKDYVEPFSDPKVNKYNKLFSCLGMVNTKKLTKKDEDYTVVDSKHFFLTNGVTTYYNTRVEYKYLSEMDLWDVIHGEHADDMMYGKTFKTDVIIDNTKIETPKAPAFEFNSLQKDFDLEVLEQISRANIFTTEVELDGVRIFLIDQNLYFPFKWWEKNKDNTDSNKTVVLYDIKYRVKKLTETAKIEFSYKLKHKDIDLEITQQFQVVNLDYIKEAKINDIK